MLTLSCAQNKFDEEAIYAEDILVSVCAGLVTVGRNSKVIRLVHYTTQGYFERKRSELSPRSKLEIHIEIVKACITYLELDDLRSDELTRGEEHIEVSGKLRASYPFLDYAGGHWGHHARGYTEYHVGDMIYRLLQDCSTLRLACDLIDDTGFRNFGPRPGLTLLIHFGLKHIISHANICGDSCPTCAIRYRDDTLVFLLTERDANWYDSGEAFTGAGSFFELEGKENMVRLLADQGVMVDCSVDSGEFLLTRSLLKYSGAERLEPTLTLLQLGATFDLQNITYYTPLMCAIIGGDKWGVRALINARVDVNQKNRRGRDALNYAALARHEAVVTPLLDAGADIHSRDEEGMTALCAACQGGNKNIVKLLLEKGADISAQDRHGRTPVSIATEGGQETLIQLLLNHGTEGHVEDDVDSEAGAVLDKAQLNTVWDFFSRDHEVGSSGHKVIESIRRETIRRGIDKTGPAFLDAYFEHKAKQKNSASVEEHGTESSIRDEALLDAYSKTKATDKDSTSVEEQETASSKPDGSTLRTDRAL